MMKSYLDSNFLIHYKNENSPDHRSVVEKLTQLINEEVKLYISPLALDEFIHSMLYVLQTNKVTNKLRKIKTMVEEIMDLPDLEILSIPNSKSDQIKVIELMEKFKLKPRDAYHLLTMLSSSVDSFATFDKDFKKVFSSKLLKQV